MINVTIQNLVIAKMTDKCDKRQTLDNKKDLNTVS